MVKHTDTSSSHFHADRKHSRRHPSRALLWIACIVFTVLVGLLSVLAISDWNFARGRIASLLSSKLNREVHIDGSLTAHLLSSTPTVEVANLKIGNPAWVKNDIKDLGSDSLADVQNLRLALNLKELFKGHLLFETLTVTNPRITVVRQNDGRNNFTFGVEEKTAAGKRSKESRPPKLPGIRRFSLQGGEIRIVDRIHKLTFTGTVEANENDAQSEAAPFHLRGHGELNAEPFALDFKGGALANLKMDQPYEFDAQVTAGKTRAQAHGVFQEPFDVAKLTTQLNVKGDNLAHLYYLTGLSLPFTPPYHFSGELQTSEQKILVRHIDSTVGKSDVRGEVTVELGGDRPKLSADLQSHSLNLADLSPALGKGVPVDANGKTLDSQAPKALPPDKLLPTYKFEFDRLRSMDADVRLMADSIQTQKVPIERLDLHLKLDDGVLTLDPLVFTLSQGTLAGNVQLDAREQIAKTKMDVRLTGNLEQFKSKKMPKAPLSGVLHTRAQLVGQGNSVHDIAANANGVLTAIVPHGEIRQAFAELTGINVARGLGLLLSKDQEKSEVRCGVATFKVQHGNVETEQVVFDTETVLIQGDGKIDLNNEAFDLDIEGHPKKLRLLRLRSPVNVRGTLRKPAVSVDAAKTASQAGVAAAIGSLLTPLAAALAFIDPGLAKDADCAALLAEAERATPKKSIAAPVELRTKDGTEKTAARYP